MTTFYKFSQNNSGGVFLGPAIHVFVEADSPEEANDIAGWHGIYFDDDGEIDCDCCGSRWFRVGDWDTPRDEDSIRMPTLEDDQRAAEDKVPVQKFIRKE
jgi:hypothetical protein